MTEGRSRMLVVCLVVVCLVLGEARGEEGCRFTCQRERRRNQRSHVPRSASWHCSVFTLAKAPLPKNTQDIVWRI